MFFGTGKFLIVAGVLLILAGVLFIMGGWPSWMGRLPGDIAVKKGNFSFYFPLTTCLLASLVLSLIFYFFRR